MIDVRVPLEQSSTEVRVLAWKAKVGDEVAKYDPLVELETDKVTLEVPAPEAGVLVEILLETGSFGSPGAIIARILTSAAGAVVRPRMGAAPQVGAGEEASSVLPPLSRQSPTVARALAETGLDPATIQATGRNGRLTLADVEAAAAERVSPAAGKRRGAVRSVPHDAMRRAMAQNLLRSVTNAPQVTAVMEADLSAVIAHRAAQAESLAQEGIALTYTAYLLRASATAMAAVPDVNSKWFEDRIEIYEDVNIGVGTALPGGGLLVPVIHQVQTMTLREIAAALQDKIARARAGILQAADISGGTFTVSNHGVSGSLLAAPVIIHQGQSAILGVGKLEKRAVVCEIAGEDRIEVRPMAYVSLTLDHRVLDGQSTNRWLAAFCAALQAEQYW